MATNTIQSTMRAVVCHGPAKPGELKVEQLDQPTVSDGGLLIRVHASSVNPVDLYALSPVAHLQRGRKVAVLGTDFAGVVESVGSGVTAFAPGDAVFGARRGAFADYVSGSVERGAVVPKPAGVSFEDAATLAVAGSTALQALRDHGHVQSGQRVLINGASGGVGTFAVQIAKSFGAEVTAVCSSRNVDLVRGLGADTVIDYMRDDFTRGGERYDLMLDIAGSHSWSECMRVLDKGATYVGVGAAAVQHGKGGTRRALTHLLRMKVGSIGSGRRFAFFIAELETDDLKLLGGLVESGSVKPVIETTYELSEVPEALRRMEEGHLRGKLAIAVDQ